MSSSRPSGVKRIGLTQGLILTSLLHDQLSESFVLKIIYFFVATLLPSALQILFNLVFALELWRFPDKFSLKFLIVLSIICIFLFFAHCSFIDWKFWIWILRKSSKVIDKLNHYLQSFVINKFLINFISTFSDFVKIFRFHHTTSHLSNLWRSN